MQVSNSGRADCQASSLGKRLAKSHVSFCWTSDRLGLLMLCVSDGLSIVILYVGLTVPERIVCLFASLSINLNEPSEAIPSALPTRVLVGC